MSEYLNLSFEVHHIEDFHQPVFDEVKRGAAIDAAEKFMTQEGIHKNDVIIDFLGQEGYLAAYTPGPVRISNVDVWVPEVIERWEKMAKEVMGADCKPKVVVEYE